jgi:hypothetical protein
MTSIHIGIKTQLSKLNSLKLELGAGILHERINGSEFSIIDCDENTHYCDIRKRHTSIFALDSILNRYPCVQFQRPDAI